MRQSFSFWTADIETGHDDNTDSALSGDTVYVSWCDDQQRGFGDAHMSLTSFLTDVFFEQAKPGTRLYLHNGMRFDLLRANFVHVAEYFARRNLVGRWVTDGEGNPKALTVFTRESYEEKLYDPKNAKLETVYAVCDSFLLTGMGLGPLTKKFAPDMQKMKRKDSFDVRPFDPSDKDDVDYAIRDAVALHKALDKFDEVMQKVCGASVHEVYTAPGLAMKAFRRGAEKDMRHGTLVRKTRTGKVFDVCPGVRDAARMSYQGGMTLALSAKRHKDVVGVDCNSMYPAMMLQHELPTGKVNCYRHVKLRDVRVDDLVVCTIDIPAHVFPVLKSRNDANHVGNYCGRLVGVFWGFELEMQVGLGATVHHVHKLFRWAETTNCVMSLCASLRDLRMSDYNGPVGAAAKLLGNSLYGKFAQREQTRAYFCCAQPTEDMLLLEPGLCTVYEPTENPRDLTHWASYITARARVHLARTMQRIGFENVVYCDTDSIYAERDQIAKVQDQLGDTYGLFKVEREVEWFQAFAPKSYHYRGPVELEDADGKKYTEVRVQGKNKGIPRQALERMLNAGMTWEEINKVGFVSLNSLRTLLHNSQRTYGRKTSRKLATHNSLTNGRIDPETLRWQPTAIHMELH